MLILFAILFSVVLIIGTIIWMLRDNPFESARMLSRNFPVVKRFYFTADRREQYRQVYLQYSFFAALSQPDQERFVWRCIDFLMHPKFVGMDGLEITDEHRLLTAYAAVRVAWGHDAYCYPSYETIDIYPDYFKTMLKGGRVLEVDSEVTSKGKISLAWSAVKKGLRSETDATNTALFAFAEAMYRGVVAFQKDDFLLTSLLTRWDKQSTAVYEQVRAGKTGVLPSSAGRSKALFFAFCIESFLENTTRFQQAFPELYPLLAQTLNQDPLQPGVMLLPIAEVNQALAARKYGRSGILNYFFLAIAGLAIFAYTLRMLPYFVFPEWLWVATILLIVFWRTWPFLRIAGGLKRLPIARLAGAVGLGFATITVIVIINQLGTIGPAYEETYRNTFEEITDHQVSRGGGRYSRGSVRTMHRHYFKYENGAYSSCYMLRHFDVYTDIPPSAYSVLTFQRGLLGIPMLVGATVWDEEKKGGRVLVGY